MRSAAHGIQVETSENYLLAGAGGVFAIHVVRRPRANVCVRGDAFRVNGYHEGHVRDCRLGARRAASILRERAGLDVEVRGLIVVLDPSGGFTVEQQPRDGAVHVLADDELSRYLADLPPTLSSAELDQIIAALAGKMELAGVV